MSRPFWRNPAVSRSSMQKGKNNAHWISYEVYWSIFEGSIDFEREEDAILDVELFLVSLENSESTIKAGDFLQFCVAVDHITILGFTKPIEVFFTDRKMYPKSSTVSQYDQLNSWHFIHWNESATILILGLIICWCRF